MKRRKKKEQKEEAEEASEERRREKERKSGGGRERERERESGKEKERNADGIISNAPQHVAPVDPPPGCQTCFFLCAIVSKAKVQRESASAAST